MSFPSGTSEKQEGEFGAGLTGRRITKFRRAGDDKASAAVVTPAFCGEARESEGVAGRFVMAKRRRKLPFVEKRQIRSTPERKFNWTRFVTYQNAETSEHGRSSFYRPLFHLTVTKSLWLNNTRTRFSAGRDRLRSATVLT